METIQEIIKFVKDPALILAILSLLRVLGEVCELIGERIEGNDPFDKAGVWLGKIVTTIGKILNTFGIGNKQRR